MESIYKSKLHNATQPRLRISGTQSKIQLRRLEIAQLGREYLARSLGARGWAVYDLEKHHPNFPNYDLVASKVCRTVRIQVKSKEHREKVRLADSRRTGTSFFNCVSTAEAADFVACVRIFGEEREVFIFPTIEAESIATGFAAKFVEACKNPRQPIELFVSHRMRQSSFYWNCDGRLYDKYRESWHLLE